MISPASAAKMPGGTSRIVKVGFSVKTEGSSVQAVMDSLIREINTVTFSTLPKLGNILLASVQRSTVERLSKDPTGALARSWRVAFGLENGEPAVTVFSDKPYAAIHNDGNPVIRPKAPLKNIAIPMSGVPRGMSPRDWPKDRLKFIPIGRKKFLAEVDPKGNVIGFRYVLVKKVKLKATRYLDIAAKEAEQPMEDLMAAELEAALGKAT